MAGNKSLDKAKSARQDEFYTQLTDIEKELRYYRRHFKDKTVLCNCDDPFESNFFKYFVLNFNKLKLRRLIATCYAGSPIMGQQVSMFGAETAAKVREGKPYKAVVNVVRDSDGDGAIGMVDVARLFDLGENALDILEGDGDFRSPECLELLDEADVVVSNPPFSTIREFVTTLIAHEKKFVIIGPLSLAKYKETFPLIRDDKMWLGYYSGDMAFMVPDYFEPRETRYWQDESGQKWRSLGNISWFTNLDIKKRHDEMILVKTYKPEAYPAYTNYDGIDVARVVDIPRDWPGNMGVPISFLSDYNPEQFEIVGLGEGKLGKETGISKNQRGRTDLEIIDSNGEHKRPYARIIIRNRHPEEA